MFQKTTRNCRNRLNHIQIYNVWTSMCFAEKRYWLPYWSLFSLLHKRTFYKILYNYTAFHPQRYWASGHECRNENKKVFPFKITFYFLESQFFVNKKNFLYFYILYFSSQAFWVEILSKFVIFEYFYAVEHGNKELHLE